MPAHSTTGRDKVAYRFQRVYAGLQTGHSLTVQSKRNEPVSPFMQQSSLDSACGVHVVAILLIVFDLVKPSALHDMARRKFGTAALVWKTFSHTYFSGVDAPEWVELVQSLALPIQLTPKYGAEDNADGYAVDWLMRGDMVALAFASVKHQRTKHWSLAVGVEGLVIDKVHHPDTLLLLDPSASEPAFAAFNARLRLPLTNAGLRSAKTKLTKPNETEKSKSAVWMYAAAEWHDEEVRLLAAVRCRRE
jgi:hypothetical protein